MTLKEKFENIFKPFRPSTKGLEQCEKVANEFAIGFAVWNSYKYKYLPNKGWFNGSYQLEMDIFITSKELLEIYKKEKTL